jgi:hypothetical protein
MKNHALSDPARFAEAIRGVAYEAHRTLKHSPSPAAVRRLTRRIELLSSTLGDRRGGPLGAWLDSLGRELRSPAVRRAGSPRPLCIYAQALRRNNIGDPQGSAQAFFG